MPNATPIQLQSPSVLSSAPAPISNGSDKGFSTSAMTVVDLEKGDHTFSSTVQIEGVSVEFRNISFHYPAQDPSRGLHNVNIFIAPGTTTAIVGHTGKEDLNTSPKSLKDLFYGHTTFRRWEDNHFALIVPLLRPN